VIPFPVEQNSLKLIQFEVIESEFIRTHSPLSSVRRVLEFLPTRRYNEYYHSYHLRRQLIYIMEIAVTWPHSRNALASYLGVSAPNSYHIVSVKSSPIQFSGTFLWRQRHRRVFVTLRDSKFQRDAARDAASAERVARRIPNRIHIALYRMEPISARWRLLAGSEEVISTAAMPHT